MADMAHVHLVMAHLINHPAPLLLSFALVALVIQVVSPHWRRGIGLYAAGLAGTAALSAIVGGHSPATWLLDDHRLPPAGPSGLWLAASALVAGLALALAATAPRTSAPTVQRPARDLRVVPHEPSGQRSALSGTHRPQAPTRGLVTGSTAVRVSRAAGRGQ